MGEGRLLREKGNGTGKTGRPPSIEPISLNAARRAGMALLVAEEDYINAIIAAREAGNSTNQIGKALGISHQKILKILAEDHIRFNSVRAGHGTQGDPAAGMVAR
jgi:DNA invertase Pin-like site-specific DNA recombinase